jgi:hypothetical protein
LEIHHDVVDDMEKDKQNSANTGAVSDGELSTTYFTAQLLGSDMHDAVKGFPGFNEKTNDINAIARATRIALGGLKMDGSTGRHCAIPSAVLLLDSLHLQPSDEEIAAKVVSEKLSPHEKVLWDVLSSRENRQAVVGGTDELGRLVRKVSWTEQDEQVIKTSFYLLLDKELVFDAAVLLKHHQHVFDEDFVHNELSAMLVSLSTLCRDEDATKVSRMFKKRVPSEQANLLRTQ